MKTEKWLPLPKEYPSFDYDADLLRKNWAQLHAGDQEPYPGAEYIEAMHEKYPAVATRLGEEATDSVALQLQQAWCHFHNGAFQQAVEIGDSLGLIGSTIANKSTCIYADYLEEDEEDQLALYQQAVTRAETACESMPENANTHYFLALGLGRYSQCISITKALTQGLGGKIKQSLDKTLELVEDHAEAHLAMGLYHAEIIDKIGAMMGSLTYGASKETAMAHFERALKLAPDSPIVHMEYANGLLLLFGKGKINEATQQFEIAAANEAMDAMQALDIDTAKYELE